MTTGSLHTPLRGNLTVGSCFHNGTLTDVCHGTWRAPKSNEAQKVDPISPQPKSEYSTNAEPLAVKVVVKMLRCVGGKTRYPYNDAGERETLEAAHLKLLADAISLWKQLGDEHVLPVVDYKLDSEPYIVTPFVPLTLRDWLRTSPCYQEKLRMLKQVADGIAYLHSAQPAVVHGGLSIACVVISEGKALVSSYGLDPIYERIATDVLLTVQGKVDSYIPAPEVLQPPVGENPQYTPASDTFDFGSFTLEMFSGKLPYKGYSKCRAIVTVIGGERARRADHPDLSSTDPLWRLVDRCWSQEPTDRPRLRDIVRVLTFPDVLLAKM